MPNRPSPINLITLYSLIKQPAGYVFFLKNDIMTMNFYIFYDVSDLNNAVYRNDGFDVNCENTGYYTSCLNWKVTQTFSIYGLKILLFYNSYYLDAYLHIHFFLMILRKNSLKHLFSIIFNMIE